MAAGLQLFKQYNMPYIYVSNNMINSEERCDHNGNNDAFFISIN